MRHRPLIERMPESASWGAWIWSPSISPLGVGLDLIPLNFPLGCGPGSDPPQFPPWVMGLDLIHLNSPLGCGPGGGGLLLGGLLGRCLLLGGSPWRGASLGVSLEGVPPFWGVSLLWGGCTPWRGYLLGGGLLWGSPWRGVPPSWGSSSWGSPWKGVSCWGCLLLGVPPSWGGPWRGRGASFLGGSPWMGCLLGRGSHWQGGSGIPACTEADPPWWTESHTAVKTLPWPQLGCGR